MAAAEGIADGAFERAFAFIGAGGHHAGRDYFGGYCCYNDVVIAIAHLRATRGIRRFAILDTDAHHGDGTRDLTEGDPAVLHVCICGASYTSPDETKVDVPLPAGLWGGTGDPDALYLETAEGAVVLAGQALQSRAEWEGATDEASSGAPRAPDRDAYAASVRRLRALEPVRVHFAHDPAVWERA